MIQVFDSGTDGEGIRAVDTQCDQTRRRYADFRQVTIHRLEKFQVEQPEEWDRFMAEVQQIRVDVPLPYSYDELNSLSA